MEELPASALFSRDYATGFQSDTIDIPVAAQGDKGYRLEYKVRMKKDAALVYEWTAPGVADPEQFYSDLHGETEAGPSTLATYRQAVGTGANGFFVAAFDGIHGWYLENKSPAPVVVRLKLSGFYELVRPNAPK